MSMCSKANQKLSALVRIAKYLTIDKQKKSQTFIYCGRIQLPSFNLDVPQPNFEQLNQQNTRRALSIVYDSFKSNFKELLEWNHSFTMDERDILYLAIEASKFKIKNDVLEIILPMKLKVVKTFKEQRFKLCILVGNLLSFYE